MIKFFVIGRILIGCLFIVSGFEKLIGPYQNFLYIVQSYEFLPTLLEEMVARTLPWIELFLGVFLVVGLWLKWALRSIWVVIFLFILIVSQALLRKLPIDECGCFGGLISLPLYAVLIFDSTLFLLTGVLLKQEKRINIFSLDQYFRK
ncbi:DoxX family membrane protein [candidate division KSB1 bacterium]|nr:DoxX family membrane protein [candidate division KSB1 bacterium]